MLKASLISTLLRAAGLGSKFLFIIVIARYLEPSEVGTYSLMIAAISVGFILLGMEFHFYVSREIVSNTSADQARMIRDQWIYYLLVYLLLLPLMLGIFLFELLPWQLAGWFYLLLVLEHMAQEMYRTLIILSRPIRANLVLFIRSGSWAYLVIALYLIEPRLRETGFIWLSWAAGVIVSLIVGAYALSDLDWKQGIKQPIRWNWIRTGAKTAMLFFIGAAATRTVEFLDRFFIQHFLGEASVGVYSFYANIANAILAFVSSGVLMILMPKVVAAWKEERFDEYRSQLRKMAIGALIACVVIALVIYLFMPLIHVIVDREAYITEQNLFPLMAIYNTLFIMSMIPHYVLYVRNRDRWILFAALLTLPTALLLHPLLIPQFGIYGAALTNLIVFALLLGAKSLFAWRITRGEAR